MGRSQLLSGISGARNAPAVFAVLSFASNTWHLSEQKIDRAALHHESLRSFPRPGRPTHRGIPGQCADLRYVQACTGLRARFAIDDETLEALQNTYGLGVSEFEQR